jgi:hypothetical protein
MCAMFLSAETSSMGLCFKVSAHKWLPFASSMEHITHFILSSAGTVQCNATTDVGQGWLISVPTACSVCSLIYTVTIHLWYQNSEDSFTLYWVVYWELGFSPCFTSTFSHRISQYFCATRYVHNTAFSITHPPFSKLAVFNLLMHKGHMF